jgi:hypothetical protein
VGDLLNKLKTGIGVIEGYRAKWEDLDEELRDWGVGRIAGISGLDMESFLGEVGRYESFLDTALAGWTTLDDTSLQKAVADFKSFISRFYDELESTFDEESDDLESKLKERGLSMLLSLVGVISDARILAYYTQYLSDVEDVLLQEEGLSEAQSALLIANHEYTWDTLVNTIKDKDKEIDRIRKDAISKAERDMKIWEGKISSLLAPTDVTAEDMWETGLGIYQDKWDEPVRQMRAGMAGSEEFKHLFPEDIWGDEAARKQYGQQYIDQFYSGMHLDDVNWDALVADYDQMVSRELGQANLLERAKEELIARGRAPTDDEIQKLWGMESPAEAMFFGGKTSTELGESMSATMAVAVSNVDMTLATAAAPSMVTPIMDGVEDEMKKISISAIFISAWVTDIGNNEGRFRDEVGLPIGRAIWSGMIDAIVGSKFLDKVADEVFKMIKERI